VILLFVRGFSTANIPKMLLTRPSRECPYTAHLPYAENIQQESKEAFKHILRSLDEAISKRSLSAIATVLRWIVRCVSPETKPPSLCMHRPCKNDTEGCCSVFHQ
jgi:hypothetical protein